ncbi:hypothetical protein E2C01_026483 [Portunus trituberculatus]|uniref:Uncharacterized protein n=1 Tax=Portunus trituberculatus TaxID=210409 RepID=A0A5B7EFI5_PORTR|nr:hypothetical protein [Portunus trituberculatus]
MLTALLTLLTACLPSSCGLVAQGFLLPLIPILSNFLIQKLTSILNHSYIPFSGKLWNSLPASVFPSSLRLDFFYEGGFKTFYKFCFFQQILSILLGNLHLKWVFLLLFCCLWVISL